MVIFWGSQSGTSEGFANRLAREIHSRFSIGVMSADLSDYDSETIALIPQSSFAVFILSTFGEGDPSDNTQSLWEWILKTNDSLSQLRYVAFGLGNSNYKYYNRVVDVITEAFDKLGAKALLPTQKADDANGTTEEDFMSWRDDLVEFLRNGLHLKEKEARYEPTLSVELSENSSSNEMAYSGQPLAQKIITGTSPSRSLRIKQSSELFSSPTRHCIHMDVDLSNEPELRYKTGDHLAVFPVNPDTEVDMILNTLGLTDRRKTALRISTYDSSTKLRVPSYTTIETLFKHYLEICAPVSRDTLRALEQFAPSESARQYLKELSRDKTAFAKLLSHTYLTLGRLLQLSVGTSSTGTWKDLPLSFVVETLASTQPRYYSISSSSVTSPRQPAITVLVSKTALPNAADSFVHGVTSNYIRAIHEHSTRPASQAASDCPAYQIERHESGETRLFAQIRRSKFKLPAQATTPIIMICAGTGVAPFRAFVEERARFAKIGREVGQMLMFFGCRRPEEDYIYRDEFEEHQKTVGSDKLPIVTAFSRVDQIYVQDRVREDSERVIKLLEDGAYMYICGRAAMAREVGNVVQAAMQRFKCWSDSEVKEWSESHKRRRLWQEDVWG